MLASDGIWDNWKYDDFSKYCIEKYYNQHKNIIEFGQHILDESIRKGKANFGVNNFDDASLVCFTN